MPRRAIRVAVAGAVLALLVLALALLGLALARMRPPGRPGIGRGAVRCHQTVVPLSQERAVPIELVTALDARARVEGLLELIADPSMEATVLFGHGGQIVGILRLLYGGAASGGQLRRQKGSTWLLDQDGGDLRAVRYLSPLQLTRWPARPIVQAGGRRR